MTRGALLTIASLLTVLFLTIHISDEIARGLEVGGLNMVIQVLVLAGLVYGTLILRGRPAYTVMLIVAILGTGVPIVHMSGVGLVGGRIAVDSAGSFFWVWQNIALCTISALSLPLSLRCLINLRWAESR